MIMCISFNAYTSVSIGDLEVASASRFFPCFKVYKTLGATLHATPKEMVALQTMAATNGRRFLNFIVPAIPQIMMVMMPKNAKYTPKKLASTSAPMAFRQPDLVGLSVRSKTLKP